MAKPYKFGANSYETLEDAKKGIEDFLDWSLVNDSMSEVHGPSPEDPESEVEWEIKFNVEFVRR